MSDDKPPSADLRDHDSFNIVDRLKRLFGVKGEGSLRESLEEVLVEHADTGEVIGQEERSLLFNALEFADARVEDIMVPRADILAVAADASFDAVVASFAEAEVSRMPIYRGTLDDVVAMVHVKDIFRLLAEHKAGHVPTEFRLANIQRPILFVPPSMRLTHLLLKMRVTRIHMAVVVDEYGGTDGIVTIEDLVEQIVGEIEDEHDTDEDETLRAIDAHTYEAGARLDLDDLEKALDMRLRGDEDMADVDTVGGLVIFIAGRVPKAGESFKLDNGIRIDVLEADPRRLRRLRIRVPVLDADG